MLDSSETDKKLDADFTKQIEDVYSKLKIKQQPETVQTSSIQKPESPFGSNSYYWFK